ncbi:MAG: hypothetical protein HY884_09905 [Deltaproteobacteria bacterium]|nr:hypothetical protein [Deltaproteobacteria bacterium]
MLSRVNGFDPFAESIPSPRLDPAVLSVLEDPEASPLTGETLRREGDMVCHVEPDGDN